ncbi:hypothetical protein LR013_04025 [candidate division NPL-UPA2 bacterium]|nr:hypothetical protein [candidate division NPL-UPA2 bacterium]
MGDEHKKMADYWMTKAERSLNAAEVAYGLLFTSNSLKPAFYLLNMECYTMRY